MPSSAVACVRHTVPICISFSARNYGTFPDTSIRVRYDTFQRTRTDLRRLSQNTLHRILEPRTLSLTHSQTPTRILNRYCRLDAERRGVDLSERPRPELAWRPVVFYSTHAPRTKQSKRLWLFTIRGNSLSLSLSSFHNGEYLGLVRFRNSHAVYRSDETAHTASVRAPFDLRISGFLF